MQCITHGIIAVSLVTLTLSACRDSIGPRPAAARLVRDESPPSSTTTLDRLERIAASAIDPATDYEVVNQVANAEHYVWINSSAPGNAKLLVFLPGATFRPAEYQLVEREAARLGYYVIGLMYQNNLGVEAKCKKDISPARNCSELMRREILTGEPVSGLTEVSEANSIDHRLTRLIQSLADDPNRAEERWSRFLEIDAAGVAAPKWSQIAVAGHSQGAGEAAYIAKLRHVARVVMFAGPPERSDSSVKYGVDSWIGIGLTPVSKYFALYHNGEPLALDVIDPFGTNFSSNLSVNMTALGMFEFGGPALVEANRAPYDGTHVLYTDLSPADVAGIDLGKRKHRSTSMDAFTHLPPGCSTADDDGCAPTLREAWRYLLK